MLITLADGGRQAFLFVAVSVAWNQANFVVLFTSEAPLECLPKELRYLNENGRYLKRFTCPNVNLSDGQAQSPTCFSGDAVLHQGPMYCAAHRYRFPQPYENTVMCVPQKNGNTNMRRLFAKMHTGRISTKYDLTFDYGPLHSSDSLYIVTRNPYARLLSFYLDRWQGVKETGIDFETFVSGIYNYTLCGGDLCALKHELCSQRSGCMFNGLHAQMLPLEEISTWFTKLAQCMSLEDAYGDDWYNFTGRPCFLPVDGRCVTTAPEPSSSLLTSAHGYVHSAGANAAMMKYYTPASAALVTQLFADDIREMHYHVWDGLSPSWNGRT